MLFNSFEFALFFSVVFFIYWAILSKNYKTQNLFLILSSYFFYSWWDWRFLSLIIFSSFSDFIIAHKIDKSTDKQKRIYYLKLSIILNIGLLAFFKYFNFFIDNFIIALDSIGLQTNSSTIKIILPIGISFYSFQTLSYTIDVYKNKIKPTNDIMAFFAFVSFFPQLVSGPIERARNLLPQFCKKRKFVIEMSSDGVRQILLGLFKKIVIADNCAIHVEDIFDNFSEYSGVRLLLGAIFFAFQIYCDFSGYSDIAIGTAKLLGFSLMQNFSFPYFSRNIGEFWTRWHISLSTWFRDYLFIPLGGSKSGKWLSLRNIFIVFLVSGFWHGPNWTFIAWGFVHSIFYAIYSMKSEKNIYKNKMLCAEGLIPSIKEIFQMGITFTIVTISWIIFRADKMSTAVDYLGQLYLEIFSINAHLMEVMYSELYYYQTTILFILLFVMVEWLQRNEKHALEISRLPTIIRTSIYNFLLIMILFFGTYENNEFIYFQF